MERKDYFKIGGFKIPACAGRTKCNTKNTPVFPKGVPLARPPLCRGECPSNSIKMQITIIPFLLAPGFWRLLGENCVLCTDRGL